jgi:uncharacterized protein YdeI (YjbR/CyaY-like superfamily)
VRAVGSRNAESRAPGRARRDSGTAPSRTIPRGGGNRRAVKAAFFPTAEEFRRWLEQHRAAARELWVGFYKVSTGRASITWPESVDEALCVGWIDGIRKSLDESSYPIRFTPRKPRSTWSAVNIRRARALTKEGRVHPAGLHSFEARRENRSGIYSYEQRPDDLAEPYRSALRKHKSAWSFFRSQPPHYRRAVTWWVVSAKREETREKRLDALVEHSAGGRRIPQFLGRKPSK